MNILLDTHVFIWLDTEPEKLSKIALELCSDESNQMYLSPVGWAIFSAHQDYA